MRHRLLIRWRYGIAHRCWRWLGIRERRTRRLWNGWLRRRNIRRRWRRWLGRFRRRRGIGRNRQQTAREESARGFQRLQMHGMPGSWSGCGHCSLQQSACMCRDAPVKRLFKRAATDRMSSSTLCHATRGTPACDFRGPGGATIGLARRQPLPMQALKRADQCLSGKRFKQSACKERAGKLETLQGYR
jgi:hypothetical protein